jgi:predicted GIY-YIG superfamily endonuclease
VRVKNVQYENFDRTMRELMSVPHDEIKAALDAEKAAKKQKKKRKAKKPSASGRADRDGG